MKKIAVTIFVSLFVCLLAAPAFSNDNCVMCHQDKKDNAVEAHKDCMACHAEGAEEHAANIQVPPKPVTNATCETCHAPTEDFMAISAHTMGMECTACHTVHEK